MTPIFFHLEISLAVALVFLCFKVKQLTQKESSYQYELTVKIN